MEAREMRVAAAADVAAMIAKAQAEAESHRHEVEQQLIERATALEGRTTRAAATTEADRLGLIQQRAREQVARLDRTLGEAFATL